MAPSNEALRRALGRRERRACRMPGRRMARFVWVALDDVQSKARLYLQPSAAEFEVGSGLARTGKPNTSAVELAKTVHVVGLERDVVHTRYLQDISSVDASELAGGLALRPRALAFASAPRAGLVNLQVKAAFSMGQPGLSELPHRLEQISDRKRAQRQAPAAERGLKRRAICREGLAAWRKALAQLPKLPGD
eukprot:CAMPEP_0115534672 /NCGR_PEP_ID=MMETSP0271-20121206/86801_1 /TAXON_ID=71861 /ORGANISM="Scrippsiella trochoidea, Strain CCMP3099" /LENGTH=192 /DNA_ID=CAMNT_0002967179 /DNA_START=103 /DNA_END=680 /DNA_ORIENTATION=+